MASGFDKAFIVGSDVNAAPVAIVQFLIGEKFSDLRPVISQAGLFIEQGRQPRCQNIGIVLADTLPEIHAGVRNAAGMKYSH